MGARNLAHTLAEGELYLRTQLIHLETEKCTWERGSYTCRRRNVLVNAAHILGCKRRNALVAQVLCTWGTVETAELQLGREFAVGQVL